MDEGLTLSDSYVITGLSPYTRFPGGWGYPRFEKVPPSHWQVVETIRIDQKGFFDTYDPVIRYAPPSDCGSPPCGGILERRPEIDRRRVGKTGTRGAFFSPGRRNRLGRADGPAVGVRTGADDELAGCPLMGGGPGQP